MTTAPPGPQSEIVDPARFSVRSISTRSAPTQIADQLRTAIADGNLKTGDRLPSEHQLAESFGVSRGTVREAIRILAANGMLESTRGAAGGTFVTMPAADDVATQIGGHLALWYRAGNISLAEVDDARRLLEMECVRLAASNRTEDDLAAMRRPVEASRDDTLDSDAFLQTDLEFHTAISRAAKNGILELAMTAVHLVRPRTNRLLLEELDRAAISDQHWTMYEAIRDRDETRAIQAFNRHVTHLREVQHRVLAGRDVRDVAILDIPVRSQ